MTGELAPDPPPPAGDTDDPDAELAERLYRTSALAEGLWRAALDAKRAPRREGTDADYGPVADLAVSAMMRDLAAAAVMLAVALAEHTEDPA